MSRRRFVSAHRRQAILGRILLEPQSRADLVQYFHSRPNTISDEIIHHYRIANAQNISKDEFADNITRVVRNLVEHAPPGRMKRLGLSGDYFSPDHRCFLTAYVKNFEAVDICSALEGFRDLEIDFHSAVNSRVMAEWWFGKGKDTESFIFINYSSGITSSCSIKHASRGEGYTKIGELGHTRFHSDRKYRCGRTGCLETVASVWAIEGFFQANPDILGTTVTDGLSDMAISNIMDLFIECCLVRLDPRCIEQLRVMTRAIGVAIKNLVDLVAPDKIIVGGSLMAAEDIVLPILNTEVNTLMDPTETRKTPIEVSELGENVGAIGAATFLLADVFKLPEPEYSSEMQ